MRVTVPVALRWGDLDAYNHVNNVALMRVLEEARVRAFWRTGADAASADAPLAVVDGAAGADTMTLVARHEIDYVAPLSYQHAPVDVEMWIAKVGGASFEVRYEVLSEQGGERTCHARAASTIVLVDAETGRPRRVSASEREAWSRYAG